MKVLIVGGGGREHALAWKAAQSPRVKRVYVAPGNAGTAIEPGVENIDIAPEDVDQLLAFARSNQIDLTIVGPEVPLIKGIVDRFREAGLRIFGPTRGCAQLEGSKAYSKAFLQRHRIPTAAYGEFTDADKAKEYVKKHGAPIVIKADGLAAGKGVIIAQTQAEALAAIDDMLVSNRFGEAGKRIVIEEFLHGEEASFIVMADGRHVLPMASSQDHKARDDGDRGPNTGGMGAYSPAPVVDAQLHARIMREVIEPTINGMIKDGHSYTGFLYAGLMIAPDGMPKVLEFNCRFGDPETQPIMLRLKSDLVELCLAALDGRLDERSAEWDARFALGVVMAAGGYPEGYDKGDPIEGLAGADSSNVKVFHAGTRLDGGRVLTNGGRVLCVVGLGNSAGQAQHTAYEVVHKIRWRKAYYRNDIGHRAIAREKH
ncbi:MAG TPA: phosphoribosylamine--glycine ligase [Gammaproteobacteria bacterium]|nr:phosphoribosylamine--glycine ligase [Gammaproteobacteria bacterium]